MVTGAVLVSLREVLVVSAPVPELPGSFCRLTRVSVHHRQQSLLYDSDRIVTAGLTGRSPDGHSVADVVRQRMQTNPR